MLKTEFIAEVSSNHNRDLGRAKLFIKTAADIGCAGVKFQLFKIEELFAPEILEKSHEHRNRSYWELPLEFLPELYEYAHSLNLKFGCTPFYLDAVRELLPYVDFFKIASYELLWKDMLMACAHTKIPVVLSTGMADKAEIHSALNCLKNSKAENVTLLHCTSAYPTSIEQANLLAIKSMTKTFSNEFSKLNLKFGYSDHTVSPAVLYNAALNHKSTMIEFHLDLDEKGEEFSGGHCWLPDDIKQVIKTIREAEISEGHGRIEPLKDEITDRDWRADPEDGLRPLKRIRENFDA